MVLMEWINLNQGISNNTSKSELDVRFILETSLRFFVPQLAKV
jgi:hypothetical protein